ncbi:MAG: SusC/RagA family TonB-linked outer membrane protein [Gemmatimonadota bacterium]
MEQRSVSRSSTTRLLAVAALLAAFVGLFALAAGSAFAQSTVTGRVTDEAGAPLAGAEVFIQRFQIGAVADTDGNYTLIIPESRLTGGRAEIGARLLGYRLSTHSINLTPGDQAQDFFLQLDPLEVDAIVAVGQGLERRRETIGATVNTVSAEEINATQETNLVAALAGKAPNVIVTESSGEPGAGSYINIRGLNTLGGAQPLFIVDGVPVDNSSVNLEGQTAGVVESNRLADLNPEDIESVEILKGGAAAAVYGARGANGVVIVTTKSGQRGADARVSYKVSATYDEVTSTVPLQQSFGRGLIDIDNQSQLASSTNTTSWGLPLGGAETFNHATELYQTGHTYDHDVQFSGGSDRTTYFLSLGRTDQRGVIVGHSEYEKTSVRLKGAHDFRDNLTIGGNFAYTDAFMDAIQKGSNISGIQLAALRSPPEFNNCKPDPFDCYLTPEGLHFSYRNPNPTSLEQGRGYDNPFWIANEMPNTSDVNRTFGNVDVDWQPFNWLQVNYTLGTDYWADDRLSLRPKSSSDFPVGKLIRADYFNLIIDSSLLATLTREFSPDFSGSLTLGQNLNHEEFKQTEVEGTDVIFGTDQLDFAIQNVPNEFRSEVRIEGYFAQANVDLYDQLFLNAGIRGDKSSTFGHDERFYYPSGSVAWEFSANPGMQNLGWFSYGKARLAYGEVGKAPTVFDNVSGFEIETITDGWLSPNGLRSIYAGLDGVVRDETLGNTEIEPELTREWELGLDLAFAENRVGLGFVRYWRETDAAILDVPIAPSTGFIELPRNGAEFENKGYEVTLDVRPVQRSNFQWDVGAQWGMNESCVTDLVGAESVFLAGFTGSTVSVVGPDDVDGDGVADEDGCHPFGVHYGDDFVRFGRDIQVDEVSIDEAFTDAPDGALYIGEDGLPLYDPTNRINGDANPDWTASLRNTVTLFNKLRISALLDTEQGRDIWNGTKGALFFFGTHGDTEACHGTGCSFDSFQQYMSEVLNQDVSVAGPGAGQPVTLNWDNWFVGGLGSGFTGPSSQFIEDGTFWRLRDVSVSYTFDQPFLQTIGFSSLDVKVSGRNLAVWTDYTGIDPEANLTDQTTGRGLDYFNNPRTRSYVFTLQFNR